jgi:putative tricarboxylic transport membrane protein
MITGRSLKIGEAGLGAAVLALGAFIAFETSQAPGAANAVVGPALFPYLISAGLILVGLALLREALTGHIAHAQGLELDGTAVVLVAVGLIVQMLLLETLGWIPASTILFMVVARAFGSRKIVKDALLGLALTAASFGLFNYGLDLNLPVGTVFEELMAEPDDAAG